jgi:tripartite-type tricarboxylate transporter receptor subunit TctC
MTISRRLVVAGAAAGLALPQIARGQTRATIRVVVGFPPGGSGDAFARIAAAGLADELRQPVVVDNRAGAGGLTAAELVIRAAPDGTTLMMHTGSSAITAPISKKVPPYNALTDFTWIAHLSTAPFVIAINPRIPATDLQGFVAYAKPRQAELAYASAGIGTTVHIAAEAFNDAAGMRILHVPYRGGGPAIADTIGGRVAYFIETIGSLIPYHRDGQLRVLALFDEARMDIARDVPTGREAGVPLISGTQNFLAAPPNTSAAVLEPIASAARAVMARASIQDQLRAQGVTAIQNSSPELAKAFVAGEIARLQPLIQRLGLATD